MYLRNVGKPAHIHTAQGPKNTININVWNFYKFKTKYFLTSQQIGYNSSTFFTMD
jgi:hypothetical protein